VNFTAGAVPPPVQHSVMLNWSASTSVNITGYKVYRATTSGGPYLQINSMSGTSCLDNSVSSGQTYYYVVTSVDSGGAESGYSGEATASIPTP
jgi:fibronectin type 3 domain-containing protein